MSYCRNHNSGCGSSLTNGDGGSGFTDSSVCGDNSECFNDVICQCAVTYFSPSGNHTDCRISGTV